MTTIQSNNVNLHSSVASGKVNLVQKLITNGCDPNIPHKITGLRPIHIAASRGHLKLVQYLVENTHCNVDAVDKEGETALLKASYAGHWPVVKYLIEKAKANGSHKDRDGWTALHNACSCGNLSLVTFLATHTDVNVQSNQGHTPLMNAASKGWIDIVISLLEKHAANPMIKNNFNETAYDVAAASGQAYLCQLLEQYEMKHVEQINYNVLDYHVTVPVILIEEFQLTSENTQWYLNGKTILNKSKVTLPNPSWFWLSDWMIDSSFPVNRKLMMEGGWFYYQNKQTHWSKQIPIISNTSNNHWIKGRRWIRIMKKVIDPIHQDILYHSSQEENYHNSTEGENNNSSEPEDNNLYGQEDNNSIQEVELENQRPSSRNFEIKGSTSVSTTITRPESIFIGSSTLPAEPLLQEQIINHHIDITETSNPIESEPIQWERNDETPDCRRCHRYFSFLIRRHHCRKCGQVICDRCSIHRALLPFHQIIQPPHISNDHIYDLSLQPQRICDTCANTLVIENSNSNNKRASSLMLECPVCSMNLIDFESTKDRENHVQTCLNNGYNPSLQNIGVRYIVYKLTTHSALIGQECIICFEEFKIDDTITRLNCMCSYHSHCISSWFSKGKDCPVHSQ